MRESAPGRTLRCCPCQHGLSSAAQTGTRRVGQWARAVQSSTKSDCPQQAIQVMILLMQMLMSSPAGADSPHNHACHRNRMQAQVPASSHANAAQPEHQLNCCITHDLATIICQAQLLGFDSG